MLADTPCACSEKLLSLCVLLHCVTRIVALGVLACVVISATLETLWTTMTAACVCACACNELGIIYVVNRAVV